MMPEKTFVCRSSICILVLLACLLFSSISDAASTSIAAASDLKYPLDEIAASFSRATGNSVKITYGSSGLITTQIMNGAPFQLFLSADESYIMKLQAAGHTRDAGILYAKGRIVLAVPANSRLNPDAGVKAISAWLKDGQIRRLAIDRKSVV